MIINNKSIIGLYIWSKDAEYEKGDFVVKGDCIYKCTAADPTNKTNGTVFGKDPTEDHINFKILPGEMISTADEYFKYVEESKNSEKDQPEDKFISMHCLYDILQRMYFGVNVNGVITDHILRKSEDDDIDFLVNGKSSLDEVGTDPVNFVLQEPNNNNGVFRVSRNFFDSGLLTSVDKLEGSQNYYKSSWDNTTVIIRQYTYDYLPDKAPEEGEDKVTPTRRRVQELIDPVFGDMFARFVDGVVKDEKIVYTSPGEFKRLSIGDRSIKTTLESIQSTYQSIYNSYKETVEKKGYYFKTIYPLGLKLGKADYYPYTFDYIDTNNQNKKTPLKISDQSGKIDDGATNLGSCLYTVVISTKLEHDNLVRNDSVTFDGYELNIDEEKKFLINDSVCLVAKKDSSLGDWNTGDKKLGIALSLEPTKDAKKSSITNIYCKRSNDE